MIDLIIAYLALVVVVLLFIIAFLTLYIVYERRKSLTLSPINDKSVVVPFLTLKATGGPGGDHSNSSALSSTNKRMSKQRVRHRVGESSRARLSRHSSLVATDGVHSQSEFERFSRVQRTTVIATRSEQDAGHGRAFENSHRRCRAPVKATLFTYLLPAKGTLSDGCVYDLETKEEKKYRCFRRYSASLISTHINPIGMWLNTKP